MREAQKINSSGRGTFFVNPGLVDPKFEHAAARYHQDPGCRVNVRPSYQLENKEHHLGLLNSPSSPTQHKSMIQSSQVHDQIAKMSYPQCGSLTPPMQQAGALVL